MDSLNARVEILCRSPFWAIRPEVMPAIARWLTKGVEPRDVSSELIIAQGWEAAKPYAIGGGKSKVAVVPIEGVLTKDGPSWLGSNYNGIANALESAAADPSVKHIVLAVDSPGGEVTGLPETADILASVAKEKPVTAMVEGMSASAAYYLTSQARDIVLTPSGEVGSVGVRMMHLDVSGMLEQWGIKPTELSSGKYKTEWSPFKPLSEEAKADMQVRLDSVHEQFLTAVTSGRGARASQEIKDNRFGEGRMLSASAALQHGMIDRTLASRDFYKSITPAPEVEDISHGLPRRARLEVERHRF